MPGPALVQIHCHQHAVLDPQSEENVLGALQLKHEILKSGCCGMAGAFGFEAEQVFSVHGCGGAGPTAGNSQGVAFNANCRQPLQLAG
jgi:hypothetical protein